MVRSSPENPREIAPVAVEGTRPARRYGENHAVSFPIPRYDLHGHRRENSRESWIHPSAPRLAHPRAHASHPDSAHYSRAVCGHALTSGATGKPRAPLLRKEGGTASRWGGFVVTTPLRQPNSIPLCQITTPRGGGAEGFEVRGGRGGSWSCGRSFIGRRPDATGGRQEGRVKGEG